MTRSTMALLRTLVDQLSVEVARPDDVASPGVAEDPMGDRSQLHLVPLPGVKLMVFRRFDDDDVAFVRVELGGDDPLSYRDLVAEFGPGEPYVRLTSDEPEGASFDVVGRGPVPVTLLADVEASAGEPLASGRVRVVTVRRDRDG